MIEQVKLLSDTEEVQKIYDFVKQYPLDYPDYAVWLEKCRGQLEVGDKKVFYATNQCSIIGSVIFQKDMKEDSVLEVKNFRISEKHSGKGVGSLLELMLCSYGVSNSFKRIRVDTHSNNYSMIQFLIKRRYIIEGEENIYIPNKSEIILYKDL
jgi:ribosomal protein S18 acetylase RimI-like enzyme